MLLGDAMAGFALFLSDRSFFMGIKIGVRIFMLQRSVELQRDLRGKWDALQWEKCDGDRTC